MQNQDWKQKQTKKNKHVRNLTTPPVRSLTDQTRQSKRGETVIPKTAPHYELFFPWEKAQTHTLILPSIHTTLSVQTQDKIEKTM